MARSMTGWGRAEFSIGEDVFSVEIKCLNHRFIDISLRASDRFSPMENRVRDEIKKKFSRGSFTVHISAVSAEPPALKLNLPMARLYIESAESLRKELGVEGEINAATLLKLKDIFTFEKKGPVTEADWAPLKEALEAAFAQVSEWRAKEGSALKADLSSRLGTLEGLLFTVEVRVPKMVEAYRQRLFSEMEKLLSGRVDEQRILQEAAVFAERTDTAEEATRLKSHIEMFRRFLAFDEPIGKRLDFLCQEMGREVNTIGSKANDLKITEAVIEMKGEVEKIREQVQNIE